MPVQPDIIFPVMKNLIWMIIGVLLVQFYPSCTCKKTPAGKPAVTLSDAPAWSLKPNDWIIAHIPDDTIGIYREIAAAQYYQSKNELDSCAFFTDKTAQRFFAVRLYNKVYVQLFNLVMSNVDHQDPNDTICNVLEKYIRLLMQQNKSRPVAGRICFLKGYLLQKRGIFLEANESYLKAIELLPENENAKDWLYMFNNIVQNYISLGDYNGGVAFAQRIRHFIEIHQQDIRPEILKSETCKAFRAEGWALYELNRNQEAILKFQEAMTFSDANQKPDLLTFISKSFLLNEQTDSAFHYVHKALALFKQHNPGEMYIDGEHQLARCELASGQLIQARQRFQKELPVARNDLGSTHPDYVKIWVYLSKTLKKWASRIVQLWLANRYSGVTIRSLFKWINTIIRTKTTFIQITGF